MIATVGRGAEGADFGAINERRKLVLATFDWCAVCGLPFGDEARWQVAPTLGDAPLPEEVGLSEAPVHEICAVYSAQVCPFLSSQGARLGDDMRRGTRREETVQVVGYSRTKSVEVFRSSLQDDLFVLHFVHDKVIDSFTYSSPEELNERYQALLAVERPISVSAAEQDLIVRFNATSTPDEPTGDPGAVVVGAAVMIGAAFAPDVFRVQGMRPFSARDSYGFMARRLLEPDGLADAAATFPDASGKAAAQWLLDRGDDVPAVVSLWRDLGRQQVSGRTLPQPRPAGPGRSVGKNAPCPCGSGRKARRCHPAGMPESP
ncbi:SEC-C domain-containing protein [Streptomyces actinomycinicus]|uniref:SEC-C domain-containing protein n=1 Tax=Streptomyces actinomycinicus TaxID=1695166 RepID=A0A937JRI7_9ACTN|nr:SEC-C domain-containing protein [Streptomyces actinomycinicus]MBL1085707.1 SEC-C domain-containing protein [Streptomyces actinomycinicus]